MPVSNKAKLALWCRGGFFAIVLIYGCFIAYSCQTRPQVIINKDSTSQSSLQLTNTTKVAGLSKDPSFEEFYLGQITNFYQQIITLLSVIIGIILVISFLYLHFTSRIKAEEMAHNALETRSFQIILQEAISKKFVELKNSGELPEIIDKINDLEERMEFLEKQINTKSYTLEVTPEVVQSVQPPGATAPTTQTQEPNSPPEQKKA